MRAHRWRRPRESCAVCGVTRRLWRSPVVTSVARAINQVFESMRARAGWDAGLCNENGRCVLLCAQICAPCSHVLCDVFGSRASDTWPLWQATRSNVDGFRLIMFCATTTCRTPRSFRVRNVRKRPWRHSTVCLCVRGRRRATCARMRLRMCAWLWVDSRLWVAYVLYTWNAFASYTHTLLQEWLIVYLFFCCI